jgi:hypothetical protein
MAPPARRQNVRESKMGFCPSSRVGGQSFGRDTFHLDPTRPRLHDLLTIEEYEVRERAPFTSENAIGCRVG